MIIQQRVVTARFAAKARKNPDFAKELGLEVFYKDDKSGGKNDEKYCYERRTETDGNTDI